VGGESSEYTDFAPDEGEPGRQQVSGLAIRVEFLPLGNSGTRELKDQEADPALRGGAPATLISEQCEERVCPDEKGFIGTNLGVVALSEFVNGKAHDGCGVAKRTPEAIATRLVAGGERCEISIAEASISL